MEKILNIKDFKIFGLSLSVLSVLSVMQYFIQSAVYNSKLTAVMVIAFLLTIASVMTIAVYFFRNTNTSNLLLGIPLFVLSLSTIIYGEFGINALVSIVAFACLGVIAITNFKSIKIGNIILIITIGFNLFSTYFSGIIQYIRVRNGEYGASILFNGFTGALTGLLALVLQVSLLIYFLTKTEKKVKITPPSTVEINSGVIDFKTLLQFIENQYQQGQITEDEYNQKRAEILKQL